MQHVIKKKKKLGLWAQISNSPWTGPPARSSWLGGSSCGMKPQQTAQSERIQRLIMALAASYPV